MTVWFVSRHAGALEWLRRRGMAVDATTPSLDAAAIAPGDVVIGTLPAHVAGEVCAHGGRYFHIAMDVPLSLRGGELTAADMERHNARLEEYRVERVENQPMDLPCVRSGRAPGANLGQPENDGKGDDTSRVAGDISYNGIAATGISHEDGFY